MTRGGQAPVARCGVPDGAQSRSEIALGDGPGRRVGAPEIPSGAGGGRLHPACGTTTLRSGRGGTEAWRVRAQIQGRGDPEWADPGVLMAAGPWAGEGDFGNQRRGPNWSILRLG
ncbi:hypothetical protein NDU88_004537 [Pleurodeles waltl]|uniref:Uncharacterized protein n=1 Tax=Pleurodeles waltl TaxID=8319 RepID=A0AAV7RJF8_PLEWA|nr:hypothetical protein NDU88_004537 [Pleurodeles waltl]